MRYKPRTSPGFYYRTCALHETRKLDIVRVDHIMPPLADEPSSPSTWWVQFIGTLADFDAEGPSRWGGAATWELRLCEFSDWRRWPKNKPLPPKWAAFFERNPA